MTGEIGGSSNMGEKNEMLVTEVPSALKELARIVARTFYSIEDSLIVDMLVRHPCLREDDICDLLKFDRKMLRARMAGLKNDKFLMESILAAGYHVKHKMETGEDEKAVKMNCYYINFKTFVNIVKYKLDHMHKKMETSERDATARSSFKCKECMKSFTDLEANELFDPMTNEFKCTFCGGQVDEDASAGPQHNTRALLARFNTQMERLYDLLRAVEEIKLAPIVLEPEPVELYGSSNRQGGMTNRGGPSVPGGNWSGEASRGTGGFRVDSQQVNITFGENEKQETKKKEVPVWITESTVSSDSRILLDEDSTDSPIPLPSAELPPTDNDEPFQTNDEITSLLLRHEKRDKESSSNRVQGLGDSDSSDESDPDPDPIAAITSSTSASNAMSIPVDEEIMSDDEDEDDGEAPTIRVGKEEILLSDVNEEIIARMTTEEKERYRQLYEDLYSHMYE